MHAFQKTAVIQNCSQSTVIWIETKHCLTTKWACSFQWPEVVKTSRINKTTKKNQIWYFNIKVLILKIIWSAYKMIDRIYINIKHSHSDCIWKATKICGCIANCVRNVYSTYMKEGDQRYCLGLGIICFWGIPCFGEEAKEF